MITENALQKGQPAEKFLAKPFRDLLNLETEILKIVELLE
jgi:hypothetical protein